jgi:sugar diacid utilization regulator
VTLINKEGSAADNQNALMNVLASWAKEYQLNDLALWKWSDETALCLCSLRAVKQPPPSEKTMSFRLNASDMLTVDKKDNNPSDFFAYLTKNKNVLAVLFESAWTYYTRNMEDHLWAELTNGSVSIQDPLFYDQVLKTLVRCLPGVESGLFFLVNQRTQKLTIRTAIGYEQEFYQKVQLASGESIAGRSFAEGNTAVYHDPAAIRQAMKTMTEENYKYLMQAKQTHKCPSSLLALPLIFGQQIMGTLILQNFHVTHAFSKEMVGVIRHAGSYISLLCRRYQARKQSEETKRELQLTYQALRTEHRQFQKTLDLYDTLTALIRNNKGIDAIIRAIYDMTQTPLTYYDELLFPIATCGTTPAQTLPDHFLETREVRYAIRVKKWQTLTVDPNHLLLIIPVLGADRVIGFLCAWINEQTFHDSDRTLLEYSASILGLESMKRQAIESAKRQLFGDIFEQIIANDFSDTMLNQAKNLNLNERDFYSVLVCAYTEPARSEIQQRFTMQSCMKRLEQIIEESDIKGLVTQRKGNIIAILSFPALESKRNIDSKLKRLCERLDTIPFDVKIGIGRSAEGFIRINQSYNDAKQCIQLLLKNNTGKVYQFSNSGIDYLLMNHDQDELKLFVDDHLGPLIEFDQKKNKELVKTLMVYVANNRNLAKTTEALSIHHNTLYYRINQIESILSIDFSQSEHWMNLAIACKIMQFLEI